MNLDKIVAEKIFVATKRSSFFSRLAIFGATKLIWLLAAATLLWAILAGKIVLVFFAVFSAWIFQLAIAYLIKRHRPFQQNHKKPLMKLLWDTPSFPSGHTTLSCAVAAAVFIQDPVWGGVFFMIAALIAFCRIAVGVHYFSDILGGAVLGVGVAVLVAKLVV